MQVRQMLERVWAWWSAERRLHESLIAFALVQAFVLLVPQSPVPHTDTPAYTQWLAEQQARFGTWTQVLSALRLFTIHTSFWMRGLIAWITGIGLVHGVQAWELRQHPPRLRREAALCVGGLLLLLGWGLQIIGGWTVPEVLAWPGQPIEITDHGITLPETAAAPPWWSGRYGVFLWPTGQGLAIQAQAHDDRQQPLLLQRSIHSEPQAGIAVPLTERTPEAYFALPNQGYAFRAYLPAGEPPARIQVYRITGGDWLTETAITRSTTLPLQHLTLHMTQTSLRQFKVVYNPGALLTLLGIAALLYGTLQPVEPTGTPPETTSEEAL